MRFHEAICSLDSAWFSNKKLSCNEYPALDESRSCEVGGLGTLRKISFWGEKELV